MSQASNASEFSATGAAREDEVIIRVIKDRRRTGGAREYLCRIQGVTDPAWRAAKDVSGECLATWEVGEAARVDREEYERTKDSRKQKRDAEKASLTSVFHSTRWGKMLLSQSINVLSNAAPNRKSDCTRAMSRMNRDDFLLTEIRTSDPKRAEKDAVVAGQEIGKLAEEYDYIGKHAIHINSMRLNGSIPAEPTYDRIVRKQGQPPADRPREQDYWTLEVSEVVPLGAVVCTHSASEPADVLDTLERSAISTRNTRFSLRQHPGGKGSAIHKRPKSDILLVVYGARYKPEAYREKIRRIDEKRRLTSGAQANPGRSARAAQSRAGSSTDPQ